MTKQLSYADAVGLLEGRGSGTFRTLDVLTGGLLLVSSVAAGDPFMSFLEANGELVKVGERLLGRLSDRLDGASRHDRTERLAAAHAVVVMSAYFTSLDGNALRLPAELGGLTRAEQVALARKAVRRSTMNAEGGSDDPDWVAAQSIWQHLLLAATPMPSPQTPYEVTVGLLGRHYRGLSREVLRFVTGLAGWDGMNETQRDAASAYLREEVPERAVRRYEEDFRRLAGQFPEVRFWAATVEHRATRDQVRDVGGRLDALTEQLSSFMRGKASEHQAGLSRAYTAELDLPIISAGEVPDGLTIPTLRAAYIWPDYRVAEAGFDSLASESWWSRQDVRRNLWQFLAGHLVSPQATQAPLVVLGQPGSGKSVLTKTLSALLPANQFLVVRVALRDVHAETDIQLQIEQAVRLATGHATSWPELSGSAGNALPVVLLDGFDELLQTAGVSQTDYLERVLSFQRREAIQGRPVAMMVTSRTAVADRARCSERLVVVRLEPFSSEHVERWLEVWNAANRRYFEDGGLRPLSAAVALRRKELASQPLLLLMLALYDAGGNDLQHADGVLRESELYERLLTKYAHREVGKDPYGPPDPLLDDPVEAELFRLSVAAVAMFSRGRQWVTEGELDADVTALLPPAGQPPEQGDLRPPLTSAVRLLGRFFFVHEARASLDGQERHTYEFLHATFGEYLIGRIVLREVRRIVRARADRRGQYHTGTPGDTFLFALLSFASLTIRSAIVGFLRETLKSWPEEERRAARQALLEVFHSCLRERADSSLSSYRPASHTVPTRYAHYSVNLLTLIALMGWQVHGRELFPQADERNMGVVPNWRVHAMFWRSQMEPEAFSGLVNLVSLKRIWVDDHRDVVLRVDEERETAPPIDLDWTFKFGRISRERGSRIWAHEPGEEIRRMHHFLCIRTEDVVSHGLEPLETALPDSTALVHGISSDKALTAGHALTALWVAREYPDDEQLANAYNLCLSLLTQPGVAEPPEEPVTFRSIVLRRLIEDRHRLSAIQASRLSEMLRDSADDDLAIRALDALQHDSRTLETDQDASHTIVRLDGAGRRPR